MIESLKNKFKHQSFKDDGVLIINADCLDVMRDVADKSIDCIITSPPYWQLRDYGYSEQWGLEPTFEEYLQHLWQMMDEAWRVLKDDGTAWINLGDTYGTSSSRSKQLANGNKTQYGSINHDNRFADQNKPKNLHKCLLLIPYRFALGCIERGWILRNNIIWAKPNGMPESVTDRFTKKHESIFFFVKQKEYFFDLDSIRESHKTSSSEKYLKVAKSKTKIEQINAEKFGSPRARQYRENQYSIIDNDFRAEIINYRDLPSHDEMREFLQKARQKAELTIEEIEKYFGNQAGHHWFEKDGSYPSAEDWIKLKQLLNFDDYFDKRMTEIFTKSGLKQNNLKGKNPGDVADFWQISTKGSSEKHFATFNTALIDKPIKAGCKKDGIILDPFCGTATTGIRALQLNRRFVGIDASQQYFEIAQRKIESELKQFNLFNYEH